MTMQHVSCVTVETMAHVPGHYEYERRRQWLTARLSTYPGMTVRSRGPYVTEFRSKHLPMRRERVVAMASELSGWR